MHYGASLLPFKLRAILTTIILGCALAASARVIVTGDKDLLSLHPFRNIAIVTPAAFLALEWEDRKDR